MKVLCACFVYINLCTRIFSHTCVYMNLRICRDGGNGTCAGAEPTGNEFKWAECSLIIGTGYRVEVLDWSSMAQSDCEWALSLLAIWCLRLPRFESCIQQRKSNLSPVDSKITCLCQSININKNMHIAIVKCESPPSVKSRGLNYRSS